MPSLSQQRTHKYLHARQQHPAWLLLASRRAPLMLTSMSRPIRRCACCATTPALPCWYTGVAAKPVWPT